MLDNVNGTHQVLASGKLILQKVTTYISGGGLLPLAPQTDQSSLNLFLAKRKEKKLL